jgi:dipeptidyl aminopeptidase/acylaminoacyl peptidase
MIACHPQCGTQSGQTQIEIWKVRKMIKIVRWTMIFVGLAGWIVAAETTQAADKHVFGLDDYSGLRRAHALAVSPDGTTILYQVSFDGMKGPEKHEWHLIAMSGENESKLDLPENFEPAGFTKDGASLYGEYGVEKKEQLAIVPLAQGKITQILSLPNGIRSATLSPDGIRFAVLADPRAKDPLAGIHNVIENDQTGLYVVGVNGTDGRWWCPSLKDITDIAWSPDGSQLAVVTQTPKIGHHELHSFIDICSASGARRLAEIPNSTSGIAWANGGKELAFASTNTPVLTPDHLWTVPVSGGAPVDRTPQLTGSILAVTNDPHGTVWLDLHKGVSSEVGAYRDGKIETAYRWPGGVFEGPPVFTTIAAVPEVLAFSVGERGHAENVAVSRGAQLQKITHEGDDTLANVNLGDVKVVQWTAKDGTKLEGIATFPAGYTAGKKYAFAVVPHGGPEANDALEFDLISRLLAAQGYVVLQPQYRGSTGYGSDFLAAIYQHFGDRAYADVDSATDFAIAQGWADPDRLAIFGWSAGGFMTSWTVTQTHRYKAAVEGAGITDWLSFIPTSDTWQVDYDARLQEKDPTPMLQFSAAMHADQVTTPLLILHGEADIRVPTFQGREFYVLLAERGKTVRMVTYPDSPHFPKLAEQRRDVFKEIIDWLAKYNP